MDTKLNVGIVGCGTIGGGLSRAINQEIPELTLKAVCDRESEKALKLASSLSPQPAVLDAIGLITAVDLVIECAAVEVATKLVTETLKKNKEIMVLSSGALIGREDLFALAAKAKRHIYIPSGALAGLDGVKSASIGKITSVILTTRKHPRGLEGAPYVVKNRINLGAIRRETLIFAGDAAHAVIEFPQNVNVAATLSLAGLGPEKTMVKIIADPKLKRNIHEIEVIGEFGRICSLAENLPSPDNPRTSYLAVLSAIATLKSIVNMVRVGT